MFKQLFVYYIENHKNQLKYNVMLNLLYRLSVKA